MLVPGRWLLAVLLCGCASPTTGLANAPKLGTWPSHTRAPYDVVADGADSCERAPAARARVWSRSPPCMPRETSVQVLFSPADPAVPLWLPPSRTPGACPEQPPRRFAPWRTACCSPGDSLCER